MPCCSLHDATVASKVDVRVPAGAIALLQRPPVHPAHSVIISAAERISIAAGIITIFEAKLRELNPRATTISYGEHHGAMLQQLTSRSAVLIANPLVPLQASRMFPTGLTRCRR